MKNKQFSRRNFIKKSAVTSGLAAMSPLAFANNSMSADAIPGKLPREVWIATISQMGMQAKTPQLMIDELIRMVDRVVACQPDIICLPETFVSANTEYRPNLTEKLEISAKALDQFSVLAKKYNSYIICPVFTSEGGKAYNAAVVLDRSGSRIGEYRKIHPTIDEIASGLTPGLIDPPVFQADFGKFGIQICYDIYWMDGWEILRKKGAEIVFWPSAFAAGQRVNIKAAENGYIVVSSTRSDTTKICDIRGETITQTGKWDRGFCCGSVNLEKVLVDAWPHFRQFNEIRKKYGRKVRITVWNEEQWSVIESLSPDLFVADIVKEFGLKIYKQDVDEAEVVQVKARLG